MGPAAVGLGGETKTRRRFGAPDPGFGDRGVHRAVEAAVDLDRLDEACDPAELVESA